MTEEETVATTTTTTQGEAAGAAANTTSGEEEGCSREELTELVRAIKFAKPDASQRIVHKEISEELSLKEGFGFLKNVKLNDVKKVWKKAISAPKPSPPTPQTASGGSGGSPATTPDNNSSSTSTENVVQPPTDGIMKLYTVGDGSVSMLAKEYSQEAAAKLIATESKQEEDFHKNYVHLFLDVPLDRSGSRPHQALINFHDNKSSSNNNSTKNGKKGGGGGKGKGNKNNNKGNQQQQQQQQEEESNNNRGEIVKIQIAAAPDPNVKQPMLLYNQNRTQKTFIHPCVGDDGYERIQHWIQTEGIGGALGVAGGSKAYFYSRLTKRKNIISVDVTALAPSQDW